FRPEERDHRLGEKLLAEAQGILAWAVRSAAQWYSGRLRDPETIRNSTKQYRETSHVLSCFYPGEYVHDDDGRDETQKLIRAFQAWAEEHNHGDLRRWSSRAFNGAMRERGLTIKRSNGTSYTYGIRRARQTDRVDDHTAPEVTEEAEIVRVASTIRPPLVGGADLSRVI